MSPAARLLSISAVALAAAAFASAGLACGSRTVAQGAATFNSCGTPWSWDSGDDTEDIYACDPAVCRASAALRITLRPIAAEDLAMSKDELMQDWTKRVLPGQQGEYKIEMPAPISIVTVGGHEGILIHSRLIDADGAAQESMALRIPLTKSYVTVDATGEIDAQLLRDVLEQGVANFTLVEGFAE